MDIEILLALQNMRATLPDGAAYVLVLLSDLGPMIAIVAISLLLYWCVDKRTGLLVAMSFCLGNLATQLLKGLVCAYRPWVRDARVVPEAAALINATGYSFPSAHTVSLGTSLGSIGWAYRTKRVILFICVAFILFTGFMRMFLGVHAPQDVLAGLVVAVLVLMASVKLLTWLEASRSKDAWVLAAALALGAIVLAIMVFKPYPLDWADGALIVDPAVMMKDGYEGVGLFWGFWLGWFAERRWVNFETDGAPAAEKILRVVVGIVLAVAVMLLLDPVLKAAVGLSWAILLSRALLVMCALFFAPALAAFIQRRMKGPDAS